MYSKNKGIKTALEREYVELIKGFDCVVCDAPGPSEAHEFEQGEWFTSVPLCEACHRGSQGWHGTRDRWKLRRVDMLETINRTVERAFAVARTSSS